MKIVRLLSAGRAVTLMLFLSVALALAAYLLLRNRRGEQEQTRPKLQGKVVAVFSNTRYAHEVHGQLRFVLTSVSDKSYEDGTHELEGVKLESFGKDNNRRDFVSSDTAKVSNPSDLDKLDAEFVSNVVVRTNDGLVVRSDYLRWRQNTNTVETDKPVEFEGRNFSGRTTGLYMEADSERAHLLHDVDVTIQDGPAAAEGAHDDRAKEDNARTGSMTAEEKAARKAEKRRRKKARKQARKQAREKANRIEAARTDPHTTRAGAAPKKPTRIRAESAWLEKKVHRITLEKNALVTQEAKEARADRMIAYTDASNHIERIEARGSSYLKETDKAEITSRDMDFFFGPSHQLVRGVAVGGVASKSLGDGPAREARAERVEVTFVEAEHGSVADTLTASGNAEVKVHPTETDSAKSTERELKADTIAVQYQPNGKDLKTAEATGNAVMTVVPVRAEPKADKKTIHAPRMNASFFEEDNKIERFTAGVGVRVEITALLAGQHEPRITTSKRLSADFLEDSQDIATALQEGDFKYNEGDRNAVADRAVYDGKKEFLQLRGGRPMAWDSKARTQANEIDYDRDKDETHARGDVRTTYYSRDTTGDATPFNNTRSPVFINAERADARNQEGIAVYSINAIGWQDDSFVKANRIELYQKEKRMIAVGNVESALYRVKQGEAANEPPSASNEPKPDKSSSGGSKQKKAKARKARESSTGDQESVPAFAWADRMTYSDVDRLVHYEGSVKARHGTDYIEANSVDVYLEQDTSEVDHLNAEGSVVLIQPGRRGTGDHLAYTNDDGRAVLTGKIARVDDADKGSTMGSQLTFYSRDDKIAVENQQGAGRVRTTHRMKKH